MTDQIEVTQADRDAAADYLIAAYPEASRDPRVLSVRTGKQDTDPSVQAFARHRIANTRPSQPSPDTAALQAEVERLREENAIQVMQFARAILHGDEVHRAWLLAAAQCWVQDKPLPSVRQSSEVERLREEWDRGYLVALGTLIHLEGGPSTHSEEILRASGITRERANSLDLTGFDLDGINDQFEKIEARAALKGDA